MLVRDGDTHPIGTQLAMVVDLDCEGIMKHGSANRVEDWRTKTVKKMSKSGCGEFCREWTTITFEVGNTDTSLLDEINKGLGCTGRMAHFIKTQMQAAETATTKSLPARTAA